jgi:membrane-associated phospholipid phosphatase
MGRTEVAARDDGGLTRRGFVAGTAVLAGTTAVSAWRAESAHAAPLRPVAGHTADVARRWVATAYDLVLHENLSPPAAARAYAAVGIAMYEAIVAGMPAHLSLGPQLAGRPATVRPSAKGHLDWPTALSSAVAHVLEAVLPFRAAATRPLLDGALATELAARRAARVPEQAVQDGMRHGRAVGQALAAWLATDGYAGTVDREYAPPAGAQHLWESTPPNFRPAVEPHWAEVRPLVLRTADEIVPAEPIPFDADPSSAFGEQALATYRQSFANTDEHRAIARFWTDNPGSFTPPFGSATGLPAGHWMLVGSEGVRLRGLGLDGAVETFAVLGVVLHDAFLNCWTWKYRYNLLRPVTYVRRYVDPTWSTFVNSPQFPEYTSGHSVASPAAAEVLTALLGELPFTDDSHAPRAMAARSFTSFRHAAREAAQSRLYGGIHYPMSIENGFVQGEQVAAAVLARVRTRRTPR